MLKTSLVCLSTSLVLGSLTPAYAQEFDTVLEGLLTPEELQIHQQVGSQQAEQLGQEACSALAAGSSVEDFATKVAESIAQENVPEAQLQARGLYSGKVIAVGVALFCPERFSQLQAL
ncbi:DUF732 domain-containing protein [Laspinema olomoucense]|uniref:DUF732 domain-containing protein n=1 Tax=Laspinema olomoucense TaxID=3231600 RepID=UPI0021BAAA90|nr:MULTISPECIES: DUF732 domain-containing protein [unclassified Laspinema]MCT7987122.1 DUF732 domain-containing protein [Laspinema sp. D3a]MCT7994609.1 DUF732 domain-containing protein [Laspinema sp. D3c]